MWNQSRLIQEQVKSLLWTLNYHRLYQKETLEKLKELSRKHGLTITINNSQQTTQYIHDK